MALALKNAIDHLTFGERPVSVWTAVQKRDDLLSDPDDDDGSASPLEAKGRRFAYLVYSDVNVWHTSCAIFRGQGHTKNDTAVRCIDRARNIVL